MLTALKIIFYPLLAETWKWPQAAFFFIWGEGVKGDK